MSSPPSTSSTTPRSARHKKSSALARRAAQRPGQLDPGDTASKSLSPRTSHSRDDLAEALDRQRLNSSGTSPPYPIEARVEVNPSAQRGLDDSEDEGISLGRTGTLSDDPAPQSLRRPPPIGSTLERRYDRAGDDGEDDAEAFEDATAELTHNGHGLPEALRKSSRGGKRIHDANSDGDDPSPGGSKGHGTKRSSLTLGDEALGRRALESRKLEPMEVAGRSCENSEDEGATRPAASRPPRRSPRRSPPQRAAGGAALSDSTDDIHAAYRQALERADQEEQDAGAPPVNLYPHPHRQSNDFRADEMHEEMADDLGDLRSFNGPVPCAASPSHHLHRQTTPSSLTSQTSTLTSAMFRDPSWVSGQAETMTQGSLMSSSALPLITTREARKRNFLFGSITGSGSLLGSDELERYFPDRKLRLFAGTWNMCEMKQIPTSLDDFILPDSSDYVQDAYVIGTQESIPNRKEWELKLQETLGPQHVLLHSAAHGVLYLTVFVRRDLIWYCSVTEEAGISTRPGPVMVKTKGAVAVCFTCFGTSFLFLCSHFSPHDGRIKDRIDDFCKISKGLQLPKQVVPNEHVLSKDDVTTRFDCVFWLGDLNFRLEKERERVDRLVAGIEAHAMPNYEDLLQHDELFRARNEGLAFQNFQEGRIKFKPTYKYDIGTDNFDTSKKMRIPSYTDRVLFQCRKKHGITCLHYDSVQEIRDSDHKPVYALFEVNMRPGRDNIPLGAGTFNREVWLEANRRRALNQDVFAKNQKSSSICSIQ